MDTIEALLDPNNKDNVILLDSDNNQVEFQQLATIPFESKIYVLLHPVLDPNPNGAALLCLEETANKDIVLNLVTDPELWTKVHAQYEELLVKRAQVKII